MPLNKRQIQWMIDNDMILRENTHLDGSMAKVWSKMSGPIKDFGKVLSSSMKLIGGDLGFLVKLTVGSLFLASDEDIRKWKQKKNSNRKSLLSNIADGASWDSMSGDAKLMGFMLNPGFAMLGASANWTQFDLPNLRATIGEYGGDSIPGLRWLFDEDLRFENKTWNRLKNAKDGDEVEKILADEIVKLQTAGLKKKGSGGLFDNITNPYARIIPGMPNAAAAITALYIANDQLSESTTSSIILEGDDDIVDSPPPEAVKKLMKAIQRVIDTEILIDEDALLEMKEKELKSYVGDIPKTIAILAEMTTTNDVKLFFKCVEKLAKSLPEDKQGKVDIPKLVDGFEKAKETLKNDEGTMEKLKKEFEKEKEEPTEESLNEKIEEAVLSSFKGQYIQELKSGLTDFLESAHAEIWDSMSEKEVKAANQTKLGKSYSKLCKKYEDEISSAITKLGQV